MPKLEPWDEEDRTTAVDYEIKTEKTGITVEFTTGEKVWMELENNRIRVHCFDQENEEPLNVDIHPGRMETYYD